MSVSLKTNFNNISTGTALSEGTLPSNSSSLSSSCCDWFSGIIANVGQMCGTAADQAKPLNAMILEAPKIAQMIDDAPEILPTEDAGAFPLNERGNTTPPPTNGVWYVTWRAQMGVTPPIPEGVNLINLFVGQLDPVAGVTGLQGPFGVNSSLAAFVQQCKSQNIPVMVSIGGHNGSYDNTWDQLNTENIPQYAQALATFCNTTGVSGIDFDWEPDTWTQAQGALVGQLIQQFKAFSTSSQPLQASLCVDSATSWETDAGWVFNAALDPKTGANTIDRLNIMAYYDPSLMEPYISGPGGWESWVKQYNPPPQVTVGMLNNASYLQQFATFAYQQGDSVGLWFWDPGSVGPSNQSDQVVWNIYHPSEELEGEVPRG